MTGQRVNGWTDRELQHLYDHINDESAVAKLMPLLQHRTRTAISVKLSRIRDEAGIRIGNHGYHHGMEAEAIRHSSASLSEAIEDLLTSERRRAAGG